MHVRCVVRTKPNVECQFQGAQHTHIKRKWKKMRHIKTESKKYVGVLEWKKKALRSSEENEREREQKGHKSNDKDNVKKILNDS